MNVIRDFVTGLLSVMKITGSPMLYRYPHRTSAEALRADWQRIGQDIENVMGHLKAEREDGQSENQ